jgi:hypothetical protein
MDLLSAVSPNLEISDPHRENSDEKFNGAASLFSPPVDIQNCV